MSMVYDMMSRAGECLLVSRQTVLYFFVLELSGRIFFERGHARRISCPLYIYIVADRVTGQKFSSSVVPHLTYLIVQCLMPLDVETASMLWRGSIMISK